MFVSLQHTDMRASAELVLCIGALVSMMTTTSPIYRNRFHDLTDNNNNRFGVMVQPLQTWPPRLAPQQLFQKQPGIWFNI